jgi:hypothetical protein
MWALLALVYAGGRGIPADFGVGIAVTFAGLLVTARALRWHHAGDLETTPAEAIAQMLNPWDRPVLPGDVRMAVAILQDLVAIAAHGVAQYPHATHLAADKVAVGHLAGDGGAP